LEYEIVAHLYRFEEYGLPQRRHRFIITGIRRDIRERLGGGFRVPAPDTPLKWQQKTAREALELDPIHPGAYNNSRIKHPQSVIDRLDKIAHRKNVFNIIFKYPSLKLNVKVANLSNIYRRLHADEPAYTATGTGSGGTYM